MTTTDLLTVKNARFSRPKELLAQDETPGWTRYLAFARHASMGVMAVCALLVMKMLTGARRKAAAAEAAAAPVLPAGALGAGALPGPQMGQAMLRQQVASALKSNPEQVRQLFTTWVQQS